MKLGVDPPTATMKLGVDLASGTAAGVSQLLVGHPFDTVKVRMQVGRADVTALAAARSIASNGVTAFYRGLAAPLTTVAAFNAILFSSRGAAERMLASDGALSIWQTTLAGGLAGFPVALLATPTELLKCRLQAADGKVAFSGPLEVSRRVVLEEGGLLALYRGLGATLLREVPGNAAYFGCYEVLKSWLARWQGVSVPQLGAASLMLAGGMSGAAFWSLTFPVDVAKSRIQDGELCGVASCPA
ncbi:hypothetical protein D9Q98_001689 [Chlorella vulgaris]|uniref:Uncharacterized protein n=1 Tax=Chlorella vulgaris TaxID=3077 RepID=A0A9D4YZY6_CHLVU|nr:hypothetical protein D9Q98_001689 [Chlorella vulgaris]